MSARWLVGLRCDGCATLYGAKDFQNRDNYLPTLTALRRKAAAEGWTHAKVKAHRDYCPKCAAARGSGA